MRPSFPKLRRLTREERNRMYACTDCTLNTDAAGEFAYMLHDRVWRAAVRRARSLGMQASTGDLCCIRCLEARLGRELTHEDFNWSVPLNAAADLYRNDRLRTAMAREP